MGWGDATGLCDGIGGRGAGSGPMAVCRKAKEDAASSAIPNSLERRAGVSHPRRACILYPRTHTRGSGEGEEVTRGDTHDDAAAGQNCHSPNCKTGVGPHTGQHAAGYCSTVVPCCVCGGSPFTFNFCSFSCLYTALLLRCPDARGNSPKHSHKITHMPQKTTQNVTTSTGRDPHTAAYVHFVHFVGASREGTHLGEQEKTTHHTEHKIEHVQEVEAEICKTNRVCHGEPRPSRVQSKSGGVLVKAAEAEATRALAHVEQSAVHRLY